MKIIKNYIKLPPSLRTSMGTDEYAADNQQSVNSSMEVFVFYIFRKLTIFLFLSISDTMHRSKPVIICILIRQCILLNLWKCPSRVPDESIGMNAVLNNPIDDAFILSFFICLYIYIYIYINILRVLRVYPMQSAFVMLQCIFNIIEKLFHILVKR